MNVAEVFGPYAARVVEIQPLEAMRASYRERLGQEGVVFPDTELQEAMVQWDAWAAQQRGGYYLQDDGSAVDLNGFDLDRTRELLQANRQQLANNERLTSLVDLGLYAKAGWLAVDHTIRKEGDENTVAGSFRSVTTNYKHLVQTGMAVEGWEKPWTDLVGQEFPGTSLSFPLEAAAVNYATTLMRDPFFTPARSHFRRLPGIYIAMLHSVEDMSSLPFDIDNTPSPSQKMVAATSLFYRTSPEGCDKLIEHFLQKGALTDTVEWHQVMHQASGATDHFFAES